MKKQEWKGNCIGYPGTPSEFEVQSYLFVGLRELGHIVRGEVQGRKGTKSIYDLVIYDEKCRPIRIIEVKKCRQPFRRQIRYARHEKVRVEKQIKKYAKLGLPVDLVISMSNAKRYLDHVRISGFPLRSLQLTKR